VGREGWGEGVWMIGKGFPCSIIYALSPLILSASKLFIRLLVLPLHAEGPSTLSHITLPSLPPSLPLLLPLVFQVPIPPETRLRAGKW